MKKCQNAVAWLTEKRDIFVHNVMQNVKDDGSPACAGPLIPRFYFFSEHYLTVSFLYNLNELKRQFGTSLHQNAFGGRALPGPAGELMR